MDPESTSMDFGFGMPLFARIGDADMRSSNHKRGYGGRVVAFSGFLALILLLSPILHILPADAQQGNAEKIPGEVIVGFSGASVGTAQAAISGNGGVIIERIDPINAVLVSVPAGEEDRFIQNVL